jgi:flagellar biosynthesis protein FlhG
VTDEPHLAVTSVRQTARAATISGPRRRARVVAVTSGKGGVGKTNFSTNLSLTLAQSGQRVIVLDADLGLANLHVVLGITPRYHLEHVMRGERTLREVLYPGPCDIQIIGGGSGITELANLDQRTRDVFVNGLQELDSLADVILIDTGAGLSHNVLAFLCAVDEIIVVTTPEPTAITDAYATIKVVSRENPSARIMLVINMAHSEAEARNVADKLTMIAHQFLRIDIDCLGYIPQDPAVTRAVRAQKPFSLSEPGSPAARSVAQIAAQLGYRQAAASNSGVGGLLNRMQRFFGYRDVAVARRR